MSHVQRRYILGQLLVAGLTASTAAAAQIDPPELKLGRDELMEVKKLDPGLGWLGQDKAVVEVVKQHVVKAKEYLEKALAAKATADTHALLAVCDTALHNPISASNHLNAIASMAGLTYSDWVDTVRNELKKAYALQPLRLADRSYRVVQLKIDAIHVDFPASAASVSVYLPVATHTVEVDLKGAVALCQRAQFQDVAITEYTAIDLPLTADYRPAVKLCDSPFLFPLPKRLQPLPPLQLDTTTSPSVESPSVTTEPPPHHEEYHPPSKKHVYAAIALAGSFLQYQQGGRDVGAPGLAVDLRGFVNAGPLGIDLAGAVSGSEHMVGFDLHSGGLLGIHGSAGALYLSVTAGGEGANLGADPAWYAAGGAHAAVELADWLEVHGSARYLVRSIESNEARVDAGFAFVCFGGGPDCWQLTVDGLWLTYPSTQTSGLGLLLGARYFFFREEL
jgi:hypothetical protein